MLLPSVVMAKRPAPRKLDAARVGRAVFRNIERLFPKDRDDAIAADAGYAGRSSIRKWKDGGGATLAGVLRLAGTRKVRLDDLVLGADDLYDQNVLGVRIAESATPANAQAGDAARGIQNPPVLHGTSPVPRLTDPPLVENEGASAASAAEGDVVEQARNRFLKFVESLETVEEVRAAHRAAKLASADIARGGLQQEGTADRDS
jgi:hypothetical protein